MELTKQRHNELQDQILSKLHLIDKMYLHFAEKFEGKQVTTFKDEDWRDMNSMYRGVIAISIKLTQIDYTYELLEEIDKDENLKKRLKHCCQRIKKFKDYFQYLHSEQMKLLKRPSPLMFAEVKNRYQLVCPEDFDDFIVDVISDDALKPEGIEFKRLCVNLLSEAQQNYHDSLNGWILDFATTKSLELFEDIYHTAKAQTSD